MVAEKGVSLYFYNERIRIWKSVIAAIGNPKYVRLYINEKEKALYIQACRARDNDTFPIHSNGMVERYEIVAKSLVKYLASVIGVSFPSDSLTFDIYMLEDGRTVYVDLTNYSVIPYEVEDR